MATGKKYGLILPSKKKSSLPAKTSKPSVFADDSSSDDEQVIIRLSCHNNMVSKLAILYASNHSTISACCFNNNRQGLLFKTRVGDFPFIC